MKPALIILAVLAADLLLAVGVGRFIRAGRNLKPGEAGRAGLRRINPVPPALPTTHQPSGSPLNSNAAPPAER